MISIADIKNTVHCADCLDIMKQLPDKCIDLVLTDPPYGVGINYGGDYSDSLSEWKDLMLRAVPEMSRISKQAIFPCCQINEIKFFYDNFPPDWIVCWYKGSPGHSAKVGFNDWEPLFYYGKRKKMFHDYFQCRPVKFDNGHPCPKNPEWYKKIINMATEKNDVILDCFAGSGTLAESCLETGRNYICIEKEPDYVEIINKRIATWKEQGRLFSGNE